MPARSSAATTAELITYAQHPKAANENNPIWDPVPDIRLWTGVILQAVQDAMIDDHQAAWTTPQRDAHDAIKWLLYPSEEMRLVCGLAGSHAPTIKRKALGVLLQYAEYYTKKSDDWLVNASLEDDDSQAQKDALKTAERYAASAKLIRGGRD